MRLDLDLGVGKFQGKDSTPEAWASIWQSPREVFVFARCKDVAEMATIAVIKRLDLDSLRHRASPGDADFHGQTGAKH